MIYVHYIERKGGRGFYVVTDGVVDPDDIIAELNAGLQARVRPAVTLVDLGDEAAWKSAANPVSKWMMRDVYAHAHSERNGQ